jgi:hypothetical protein
MLVGSNKRPDILVLEPSVSPVAIETEILPAATVESEAVSRLGEVARINGRSILSAIALRFPDRLKKRAGAPGKCGRDARAPARSLPVGGASPAPTGDDLGAPASCRQAARTAVVPESGARRALSC